MSVSRLSPAGGANDFNLNIGGTYTSVILNKEYASGAYSIVSGNNDTTLDIYAYNADGSLAGYTNTKSFTASKGFNKVVILGGQSGDVLGFTYKTTYATVDDSDEVTAGPVATSVSPSGLPNVNDTFTLTGRNFASDATVTFTSANTAYPATLAKAVTRNSATSLTVTRPDNMPNTYSPYTITVQNPGVSNPTGTNSHILANAITAGVSPVWVTGSTLTYTTGAATSFTLSATDADAGSSITYSIASGTLPTGLSLNGSTGVLSGTPSTSQQTVTFRATDSGGNYTDKAIKFNANPVWTTSATLPTAEPGTAYSTTVVATDDNGAVTYALTSGSLPSGLSLNTSSGVISGTNGASSGSTANFTITASDTEGGSTARAFTITTANQTILSFTSSQTWTVPAGVTSVDVLVVAGGGGRGYDGGGAGGGGGVGRNATFAVTPGSTVAVVVGGGGAGANSGSAPASNGSNSSFGAITAYGGGGGGSNSGTASVAKGQDGGSGGGAQGNTNQSASGSQAGGTATLGTGGGATFYGNNGRVASPSGNVGGAIYEGGGSGGGAGGIGALNTGNSASTMTGGIGGIGFQWVRNNTYYAGGGGGGGGSTMGSGAIGGAGGGGTGSSSGAVGSGGTANTGGGAGAGSGYGGGAASGGSGIVLVRYLS